MKALYLEKNGLNELEINTFHLLSSLETLQISNNQLTTIPQGVFSDLHSLKRLYIGENPWICECSLQWLKDLLINTSIVSDGSHKCYNEDGDDFENVDFGCESVTTIPVTTAAPDSETVTIHCRNLYLFPLVVTATVQRSYFQTVGIRNQSVYLEIFELDTSPPSLEIKVHGSLRKYHMFWYNVKNYSDYGCVTHIKDTVVMPNLRCDDFYTLCILLNGETTASPYDCFGFAVPHAWENRTWIPNKMIGIIVGGVSILLVLSIIITSVVVFYCIRQNPKLISGNKRVIIVGNKTVEAMIMPKSYTKPTAPPAANCHGAYLTPNNNVSARRKHMLRSMSECSIFSSPGSYITTEHQADIHEFYSRQRAVRRYYQNVDETIAVDEHIYERPPVPPNHPSEMRGKKL